MKWFNENKQNENAFSQRFKFICCLNWGNNKIKRWKKRMVNCKSLLYKSNQESDRIKQLSKTHSLKKVHWLKEKKSKIAKEKDWFSYSQLEVKVKQR